MTDLLTRFPALEHPLCERPTKFGPSRCGYCDTARSIANGMGFSIERDGEEQPMTQAEGIAYNLAVCARRLQVQTEADDRIVTPEIRRDGQRILKPGANVYVQLKAKKGTAKSAGVVVECYENNLVKIHITDMGSTKTVPADEYVTGRTGTTPLEEA
jgi:hypothetical protein